jgi:hypothetical protein
MNIMLSWRNVSYFSPLKPLFGLKFQRYLKDETKLLIISQIILRFPGPIIYDLFVITFLKQKIWTSTISYLSE